jgi:hypothetical protein
MNPHSNDLDSVGKSKFSFTSKFLRSSVSSLGFKWSRRMKRRRFVWLTKQHETKTQWDVDCFNGVRYSSESVSSGQTS